MAKPTIVLVHGA
jgi:pimeloyl-ACP methyl ester carboxylesterase